MKFNDAIQVINEVQCTIGPRQHKMINGKINSFNMIVPRGLNGVVEGFTANNRIKVEPVISRIDILDRVLLAIYNDSQDEITINMHEIIAVFSPIFEEQADDLQNIQSLTYDTHDICVTNCDSLEDKSLHVPSNVTVDKNEQNILLKARLDELKIDLCNGYWWYTFAKR
jgi:hypothetical protein